MNKDVGIIAPVNKDVGTIVVKVIVVTTVRAQDNPQEPFLSGRLSIVTHTESPVTAAMSVVTNAKDTRTKQQKTTGWEAAHTGSSDGVGSTVAHYIN